MKLTQHSLSKLTLLLTIILLASISILSYQKILALNKFNEKVIYTHEMLYKLEKIFSILKNAESGQRGFLLTGDSAFLEPLDSSLPEIMGCIQEIEQFTFDNDVQLHKIDSLNKLIHKRYEFIYATILLQSNEFANNDLLISNLEKGQVVVREIRSLLSRIKFEEDRLLMIRTSEKNNLASATPYFILVLSLFSLLLILFSYFALINELNKKILAKQELENKIEELNRSNNELEQFAYVASHDLQEPLRKIRSFGDRLLLKHAGNLDEDGKENIKKMQDASIRMQILIDDLLGFSRLIQTENKFVKTDLNEIINLVINDFDEKIKSIKAIIDIPVLPEIYAVPSQMQQLFQNLFSNALKFTRDEVIPHIVIKSDFVSGNEIENIKLSGVDDAFVRIMISDNGIGFDEQYLDRIFTIFQRLHGKLEYGGTGIGLAVSKKIVTNHGGYITAKSRIGSGSSFFLYFPVNVKK